MKVRLAAVSITEKPGGEPLGSKREAWGRFGGTQWPILYTGANHTLVVDTVL